MDRIAPRSFSQWRTSCCSGNWAIEVGNGLLIALRRGRVDMDKVHEFVQILSDLPLKIELPQLPEAWPPLLVLSKQHKLTTYDAAYLQLAQRTGLPLATLDRELKAAARAMNVPLIE